MIRYYFAKRLQKIFSITWLLTITIIIGVIITNLIISIPTKNNKELIPNPVYEDLLPLQVKSIKIMGLVGI